MKIQSLQVPKTNSPAKSSAAPTLKSASSQTPRASLEPVRLSSRVSEHERRHTQRVLLRVRASIYVALQGEAKTFDVATLSVNPHGAVVVMNQTLPADTELVLEHAGTKQRVPCKVARPPRQMSEGYHVPLEFNAPAPDFWKIDFPPSDWRPDDV